MKKVQLVRVFFTINITAVFTCTTITAHAQVALPAAYGSGINKSYVRTWQATSPEKNILTLMSRNLSDVKQTIEYLDGLGRPLQTVVKQGSLATGGTAADLVGPVVYDTFGRQVYIYLPFAANSTGGNTSINDGLFKLNAFQQDSAFNKAQFSDQSYFYSQINFEASPLNRVKESFAPGDSWVGSIGQPETNSHSIKVKYFVNTVTDSVHIWNVTDVTNDFGTYSGTGLYPAGVLFKTIGADEHNNQLIEFKDKQGHLILKKVQLTATADTGTGKGYTGWLCTYYAYDDFGNLRLMIQPHGVELLEANSWDITALSGTILSEQCFRYEYDQRNRMIRKKLPGAGQSWMVYDNRDRMVMSQDSTMRSNHQWLYIQYDDQNRSIASGLMTDNSNYNNLAYHLGQAYTSTAYPNLGSYTTEELTHTFYDDYSWRGSYSNPLSATRSTSYDSYLLTASNSTWPYPQAVTQSASLKDMITGTRAEILGTGTYLYTVNFYDEKERPVQMQSTNITGGTDIVTMQYGFIGQPLVTVLKQEKTTPNAQTHIIVTKTEYDSLDRVITVKKSINSTINGTNFAKTEQVIASNTYNKLGQLVKKKLGGSSVVDSLTYDYNIRGWLLGANRTFAKDTNSTANYFGFDLGYDKDTILVNSQANFYVNKQYNGNIEGMLWKSAGDGRIRKYDYTYDAANRLLAADFNQFTGSSFNRNANIDFSVKMGDGSNVASAYDANGNILAMNQKGFKLSSSPTIDSLAYTYQSNSNKLAKVTDAVSDTTTKLGDFHDGNNGSSDDYTYDGNGNLSLDNNKKISSITYNYLNLPQQIHITGKGNIVYTYDAGGMKLKKVTTDSTVSPVKTTTTLYSDVLRYVNDTLQFIGHEEGRARYTKKYFQSGDSAYQYFYDYFLKDHLGNTRMVLTEQKDTMPYMATMEAAYRTKENVLFYNIPQSCYPISSVAGYPADGTTSPNDSLARLNGNGQKTGPAIILKVMTGDKVDIGTKSYYTTQTGTGTSSSFTDALNSLASGIVGITNGVKGSFTDLTNSGGPLYGALNAFITNNNPAIGGKPKAYLNWMLVDEQFNAVNSGSQTGAIPVSNFTAGTLGTPAQTGISITKNGFLYIWVSNETQGWDVFFDNLSIKQYSGPLLEETHYYPFGLAMAGISSKATKPNYTENKYRFNDGTELENKEFSDGSGLELYETDFRGYDPQIGRFWHIDPLADIEASWSPYTYVLDNPILLNDPLGLDTTKPNQPSVDVPPLPEVTVVGKKKDCNTCDPLSINVLPPPSSVPAPINGTTSGSAFAPGIMAGSLTETGTGTIEITGLASSATIAAPLVVVGGIMYLTTTIPHVPPPINIPKGDIPLNIPRPIALPMNVYNPALEPHYTTNPELYYPGEPWGQQYTLRAAVDGMYPVYQWGKGIVSHKFLHRGEIWKIGTTMQGQAKRGYSTNYLNSIGAGLDYIPEFSGPLDQLLFVEKMKLLNYAIQNGGALPPGNTKLQ